MSRVQAKYPHEEDKSQATGDAEINPVTPDEDCFMTPLIPDRETTPKSPSRKRTRLFTENDGEAWAPAAKRRKQAQGDDDERELLMVALRNFTAGDGRFCHYGSYVASLCRQLEESQSKLEALGEPPRMHLIEVKEEAIRLFNRQILENLEKIRKLGGRGEETLN